VAFRIKDRIIGDGHPVYITFEAGPTHNGVESAIELVELAAAAGADAIKFQIFDPDKLVADRALPFSYDVLLDRESGKTETVTEPLYDILCRRSMSAAHWRDVKAAADAHDIAFFATVGFEEDIELLVDLGCDSIKIASADVNHVPLLKLVAQTDMSVQLDTGNASLGEIEQAVDIISAAGNEKIIIHQCPSGYPAHLESINLRMIPTLKTMFPYPAAFSDHTPGWDMDIAAVALGANLIEKTITRDRTTRSVEHIMSIEENQFRPFIQAIRDVETALGSSRRIMPAEQLEKRQAYRRSAYLKRDLPSGSVLGENDIEYRRPGYGIAPSDHDRLLGASLVRSLSAGTVLDWTDLSASEKV